MSELSDLEGHYPAQIGKYDEEGWRSFGPIGEVCAGCSDEERGVWVPVSYCEIAWAKFQRNEDEHGYGAWIALN